MMSLRSARNKPIGSNFIKYLPVASIILFVLTLNSLSITEFPADPLYYMKSLPYYYWAGISITLASILIPLGLKIPSNEYFRILSLIMLGFYVYGTPVLASETPRFQDIFIHGAGVPSIISTGLIDPTHRYASEHPNAFVFMSMSVIVQDIDAFEYFRFIELVIMLSLILLIYFIARFFNPAYAAIGPLAFVSVYWVDQGHFSPQGIAIVLYLIFFLSMIKAIVSTTNNRNWLILTILMLVAINLTSPTNSFFLLINLLTIPAVGYVISRQRKIPNRIVVIAFICAVIFTGWSTYNAESRTILKAEVFGDEIEEKLGSVDSAKITRTPDKTYLFVNNVRMFVTISVIASGVILSFILMRSRSKLDHVIMLAGWFAIAYLIIVSFYISTFLLARHFMYTIFPWAIVVAFFLAYGQQSRWYKGIKLFLLLSIIAFTILVPVTRYGREPTTYVPASLVNSGELIAEKSTKSNVIAYGMSASVTKYLNALIGGDLEVRRYHLFFEKVFEEDKTYKVEDWIRREAIDMDDKIIFSETEKNIIALKYSEAELYESFEKNVRTTDNLLINNGDARVYSRID